MSVLIDRQTRVLIQTHSNSNLMGGEASFHTRLMREYGTQIVAIVNAQKGGLKFEGIPIFSTVAEAVRETGADVSANFVPAPFAADTLMEAADSGIDLVICISEHIPVLDMLKVKHYLASRTTRLIGPNSPGVVSPGKCKIGIMPGDIFQEGCVAVLSRSGTLTYEAVSQLTKLDLGQSTCIGIGGDPIIGSTFVDCLNLLREDSETEAVVLIGEIGGTAEEEAAVYIQNHFDRPVISFIAGQTAPPGRRMGHAGAIISGGKGTAKEKMEVLKLAGIQVCTSPSEIGNTVKEVLTSN